MALEPYNGALLWINHDADNMDPLAHKQQILSHIQKRYQPWRRRQRSEALFASVKSTRSQPSLASKQGGQARFRKTVGTPSPQTVLAKGNSDPFAVYPVDIGPAENDLIILYRDFMIPSAYSAELGQKHMNILAAQDWKDSVAALEDEGTALGTLARYGSIASRCNPGMQRLAYKYLVRSIGVLRRKISLGHDLLSSTDCMHVNMLFAAEAICGNLSGAITHGSVLLQILKRHWQAGTFDYKLLIYQLFIDYQLSSMFVRRMIFDDDGEWLETALQPVWHAAAPYIPIYPSRDLDPCIPDESLRRSFENKQQQLYFMASQAETLEATSHLELVWMSQMTRGMLFHSRMISHYLKIEDELKNPGLSKGKTDQLKAQQYLALAAAQLDRHVGGHPKIMGVHVYDTSRMTMALKHDLQRSDLFSRRGSSKKYANAKLWAVYVGALAETAASSANKNPSGHWFNEILASLAAGRNIHSWDELQRILEGFLYYDGPFYIKRPACFEEGYFSS